MVLKTQTVIRQNGSTWVIGRCVLPPFILRDLNFVLVHIRTQIIFLRRAKVSWSVLVDELYVSQDGSTCDETHRCCG